MNIIMNRWLEAMNTINFASKGGGAACVRVHCTEVYIGGRVCSRW